MRASPSHHASPLHAAWVPCNMDAHDMERTRVGWRGCTRPLHTTHLLYMPRGSPVTWTRTTWRGRACPLHPGRARRGEDARVPYTMDTRVPCTPDACGVEGRGVPCTLTGAAWTRRARCGEDGRGVEKTRASPTPRAHPLHAVRVFYTARGCP